MNGSQREMQQLAGGVEMTGKRGEMTGKRRGTKREMNGKGMRNAGGGEGGIKEKQTTKKSEDTKEDVGK